MTSGAGVIILYVLSATRLRSDPGNANPDGTYK